MLIGYARVSTSDQTTDLQKDALSKVGAKKYSLMLPVVQKQIDQD